jgi:SagB-type dehydrogenase family enzyme
MSNSGDNFQKSTKYIRGHIPQKWMDWSKQPFIYKDYPNSIKIELPVFEPPEDNTLFGVIKNRKSIRKYKNIPISKELLSYLLWASTGIVREEGGYQFRTAPSAGALYPIETYLVVNNIEGIEQGVYHYSIKKHELETLKTGDISKVVAKAALDQKICSDFAVVFIWSAIFERSKWKYGQRAYRYIYLDAGHIAENLALAATSLGLGSCQMAALYDDEVNSIIEVDGENESVIYMSVVGVVG